MTQRNGILAGGHWIVDVIQRIDHYPKEEDLAHIHGTLRGNGGGAFNVLVNLSRMECPFPRGGVGLIGNDENGSLIRQICERNGIAHRQLHTSREHPTSYTMVMNDMQTGRRTFFHQSGANSLLDQGHFELGRSEAKLFYLGYLTMLAALDRVDEHGLSPASTLLTQAGELGMMTVVDLVSAPRPDFAQILQPALPVIDYLFCNEREAAMALNRSLPEETAEIDPALMEDLAGALLEKGIRRGVILHCSRGVIYRERGKAALRQGAVQVPAKNIAGAAGAGDALAAGFLLGLHEGWEPALSLELAVCAAAQSLRVETCSDALTHWEQCLANGRAGGYQNMV